MTIVRSKSVIIWLPRCQHCRSALFVCRVMNDRSPRNLIKCFSICILTLCFYGFWHVSFGTSKGRPDFIVTNRFFRYGSLASALEGSKPGVIYHASMKTDFETLVAMHDFHDCGRLVVYLPSLQALAYTGLCASTYKYLFFARDRKSANISRCQGEPWEKLVSRNFTAETFGHSNLPFSFSSEIYGVNLWEPGVVVRNNMESKRARYSFVSDPYKWITRTYHEEDLGSEELADVERGISLYLDEPLGNRNINHASRDSLFAVHALKTLRDTHLQAQNIFVYDDVDVHPNAHRTKVLDQLASYFGVSLHWDIKSFGRKPICFPVVLKKAIQYPGSPTSRFLLRDIIYDGCNVARDMVPDTILIENRSGARAWSPATLDIFEKSLKRYEWARNMTLLLQDFKNMSPCEQVRLVARSRLFIAHDGAASIGNSIWIRNESIAVAIGSQHDKKGTLLSTFDEESNIAQLGLHYGLNTVTAKVGYVKSGRFNYFYFTEPVEVNVSRWRDVLMMADRIISLMR